MSLCLGCMKEKGDGEYCPKCGLGEAELQNTNPAFLRPGTILNNRYITGIALGQGGFGITYIGYDNILNTPVAIKEYYPSDIASRASADGTISPYTQNQDDYLKGKNRFLDEARTLAKFADHPCIVGVKDCFDANGTAYMVMEYLEGVSLKEYLKRKGGKVSINEAVSTLTPVMDALKAVHSTGIIHRDISPDNIFITTDGRVRLIDFGAARQSLNGQKSLSVMLKPGYAPEEQYRAKGNQGPWTDVYALTATLYRMITGTVPPDSLERVMEDTLEIPAEFPPHIRTALMMGLAVRSPERYSSVDQLQAALSGEQVTQKFAENSAAEQNADSYAYTDKTAYPAKNTNSKILLTCIIAISIILVITIVTIASIFVTNINTFSGNNDDISSPVATTKATPAPTPTPEPVHTYEVRIAHVTWPAANQSAMEAGGHLVTINDEEEFNRIISLLSSSQYGGVRNVWIGAYASINLPDAVAAGSYWNSSQARWITGEPFTFAKWRSGEPTGSDPNLGIPEPYLQIFRPKEDGYEWSFNDSGDDISHYKAGTVAYIIEYEN